MSQKILGVFFCFIILFLSICLIYFGYKKLIEIMTINDIEIVGIKNITKSEIKKLLPFKIGDNILKVNLSSTENKIKKLKPELKNILINRRWQKIKVKLYGRTPEAFVMHNNTMFGIDFDGNLFPLRGFTDIIKVPKLIYKSNEEKEQLLDFIKRFKLICGEFLNNLSEIKLNNTKDIVFVMKDDIIVFWGNEKPKHTSYKFDKFQKIYIDGISKYKKIEYINMTFYYYGKVIIKFIEKVNA
jgi:cell division protein FtsQ